MKMKYTPEEWQQLTEEEKIAYLESMKQVTSIYAIYDRIAMSYGSLMLNNKGKGAVAREFFELINDNTNQNKLFYEHPADFELWYMGEFNMRTGEIDTSNKSIVCNGQQAIQERKTEEK